MKRIAIILTIVALLAALTACGKKEDPPAFSSPQEITLSYLEEKSIPYNLVGLAGGFQIEFRNEDATNAGLYAGTTVMRFLYEGENILINQVADYDNGEFTHRYFTTTDSTLYEEDNYGVYATTIADAELQSLLNDSIFGINYYDCEITGYSTSADGYSVGFDASQDGAIVRHVDVLVNPQSGLVQSADIKYYENDSLTSANHVVFTYSLAISIDRSPYDNYIAQNGEAANDEATDGEAAAQAASGSFTFTAAGPDGKDITYSDFSDAKLMMVNFWEPWCSPCVGEMPDLEKLYQNYKDKGFIILGVYTTADDAQSVAEQTGVTYPIVQCDSQLSAYATDSVPTTILVGQGGEVLTTEPFVGARSYADWETIIQDYLK